MTLKKVSITSKLNLVLPSWVQALKTLKKTRNVWWSNNILVVFWSKVCFRIHNKILVTRNTLFLEILCRLFDPCISMPELVNVLIKRRKYWTYLNFTQTKIGFNFFFFFGGGGGWELTTSLAPVNYFLNAGESLSNCGKLRISRFEWNWIKSKVRRTEYPYLCSPSASKGLSNIVDNKIWINEIGYSK